MITLSIRQPWAHFIVRGIAGRFKDVENRAWRTPYRGRCLIYASKGGTRRDFDAALAGVSQALGVDASHLRFDEMARGGIIGAVDIVDCVEACGSEWFTGPFGFLMRNPEPLPFAAMSGFPKFFDVSLTEKTP